MLMHPRFPSIETTTWSDDCACSDMVTCVSHQISGDLPQRPSPDVMRARAEKRHKNDLERWQQKKDRFATCFPDDPEMDATDGAHPAWWRANDYVAAKMREALDAERERANKAEAAFRNLMQIDHDNRSRWREAGLSLASVRDLVTRYELEEISASKLMEELRGLAEAATEKLRGSKLDVKVPEGWATTPDGPWEGE